MLRDKYIDAIKVATGFMEGSAEERDGKLYFTGTARTQADANRIWKAIKAIPDWRDEVIADITFDEPAYLSGETYTVKAGDTLRKVAKATLGSANAYMRLFEANRDRLGDSEQLKPGQVLRIPAVPVHP